MRVFLVWALVGLAACAAPAAGMVSDTLYFGARKPDGVVAPAEWDRFLAEVVTPRFPDGLTVWEAEGQWRGKAGALTRENSWVLLLVHADSDAAERAVREIIGAYKRAFEQEAVLRVTSPAAVTFE